MAQLYREKIKHVEAMQWSGGLTAARPIIDWVELNGGTCRYVSAANGMPEYLDITSPTMAGNSVIAAAQDWVMMDGRRRFDTMKPDVFAQNWEIVP